MDTKLLAWGRAAACRAHRRLPALRACPGDLSPHDGGCREAVRIPPLWLFTDSKRLPDPRQAVARLPRGLAGVVFRHDDHPSRAALGRDLARICRQRRLVLVVAGDVRLAAALHAGVHLRGGRWSGPRRVKGFLTSSAHGFPDLHQAARARVSLAFLAPVFATASHPGAASLGVALWSRLARGVSVEVAALGGIDGLTVRRLPRGSARVVGAIGALA